MARAKFEYYPLGKRLDKVDEFFNKGLDKDDKEEGLLKRLKNIENKNEELLEAANNVFKKEPKKVVSDNNLKYNGRYNFNADIKMVNQVSSIGSKFTALKNFHNKLEKFKGVDSSSNESKEKKAKALEYVGRAYNDLVNAIQMSIMSVKMVRNIGPMS